jgi:hypothetical protein
MAVHPPAGAARTRTLVMIGWYAQSARCLGWADAPAKTRTIETQPGGPDSRHVTRAGANLRAASPLRYAAGVVDHTPVGER